MKSMGLEKELSEEVLCPKYFQEKLSLNEIARALTEKGMKVSSETVRARIIKYGYKLRERTEAVANALSKEHKEKYGSANK